MSTYYVATTGSDSNPGTSASPWLTIQHAVNVWNPGDTVIVKAGTYTTTASGVGSKLANISRGGTSSAWCRLVSETRFGAVLDGRSNATELAIKIAAPYVHLEGFEVKGFSENGIWPNANNFEVVANHIHDIGRYCTDSSLGITGLFVDGSNGLIARNLIHDIGRFNPGESGCVLSTAFYQNHDHGIYIDGATGSGAANLNIQNNIFYNNAHGWDIQIFPNAVTGLVVANNTFADANPYRVGHIVLTGTGIQAKFINNIFYNPQTAAIQRVYSGTPTSDSIIVQANICTVKMVQLDNGSTLTIDPAMPGWTYSGNHEDTNPLMVAPGSRDYHLQAGSPAINTGVPIGSPSTTDYDGNTRPLGGAYDIGAFEYTGVTGGVGPAATHVALAASPSPSLFGQSVTFTATVTTEGTVAPTGTVTFKDGVATLGTGTLSGGVATFTTSALAVGTHTITASYGGDSNNASSSTSITQIVNSTGATLDTTTTALVASPNPATAGTAVNFTATVSTVGLHTPTGSVTFKDGTTVLGTVSVNGSGVAVISTSSLTAGTHSINASYAGDTNNSPSSATVSEVINTSGSTSGETGGGTVSGGGTGTGGSGGSSSGYNLSPSRQIFIVNSLSNATPGYYDGGRVTWLTGLNTGLTMEVKTFDPVTNVLTLYLAMPYDVKVGDTLSIYPGCDKLITTCLNKFNNVVNFRGEPYVPGVDAYLSYPDATAQ